MKVPFRIFEVKKLYPLTGFKPMTSLYLLLEIPDVEILSVYAKAQAVPWKGYFKTYLFIYIPCPAPFNPKNREGHCSRQHSNDSILATSNSRRGKSCKIRVYTSVTHRFCIREENITLWLS